MSYQVFLTDDAAYDLEALYDYIESHDALKPIRVKPIRIR